MYFIGTCITNIAGCTTTPNYCSARGLLRFGASIAVRGPLLLLRGLSHGMPKKPISKEELLSLAGKRLTSAGQLGKWLFAFPQVSRQIAVVMKLILMTPATGRHCSPLMFTGLKKRKPPLGDEGAATVAHFIRGLTAARPLTVLNLSDNTIGGQGGAALAEALASSEGGRRLTQLNLSGNLLGESGGVALSAALAQPEGLGVIFSLFLLPFLLPVASEWL